MQDPPVVSHSLLDMLEYVLDNECEKLEKLIMENTNAVNDPIGMPFDLHSGRFPNHPAMSRMVIMQHPRQTLLDIACGMPNSPVVWVLLSYGAKGSTHPLGTDLALHNAIKNGRHYTVQALLIPGRSDVNGIPNKRWKPLLQAVFWTGPEIVNILLKRGARVDDPGPCPTSPGLHTALQLCLERRAREYSDEAVRSKCNDVLKSLLNAGANIHVTPPEGSSASPFEMFIEPWRTQDHWYMKLSWAEMHCLAKFVEMGADLKAKFTGGPCAAGSKDTFVHQVIWHSSSCLARHVVDSYSDIAPSSGTLLLHEAIGTCPDTKRHLSEILRDIEVLLEQGVSPNVLDDFGMTPLRKSLEQSMTTDIAAIVRTLLDGGADPEYEDVEGIRPYVFAATNLAEHLRLEVLQSMLTRMHGQYTVPKKGVNHTWKEGLFPIPEHPSFKQVASCSEPYEKFMVSLHDMVPVGAQPVFQRAYLAIMSDRLFTDITRKVVSTELGEMDRWHLMSTLALRNAAKLPDYHFDQALVIALLGFPGIRTSILSPASTTTPQLHGDASSEITTPRLSNPIDTAMIDTTPAYPPFQLNTTSSASSTRPLLSSGRSHGSAASNDDFVGDTTQLRWLDPEAKRSPGDNARRVSHVLQHRCARCGDGRLLTKLELEKHDIEHTHTAECAAVDCTRRFCKEGTKRREQEGRCQDHLFTGNI